MLVRRSSDVGTSGQGRVMAENSSDARKGAEVFD